ncbi:MAG: tRNA lysidine(34) synthetase TilS [Alphaproteobacteria bacterium]
MPTATADLLARVREEAASLFSAQARYAVAVSGGGDSVALLRLLVDILGPARVVVLHFNHALRAEAGYEAAFVSQLALDYAVPYFEHTWTERTGNEGNMQQAARLARYRFFAEVCAADSLAGVCTGHTADDATETFLMRLGRGSGVAGLSGMQAHSQMGTLPVYRPLLAVNRAELRTYLQAIGQNWVDDPSNKDMKYLRVRLRESISTLEQLGLPSQALADTAASLQRANVALEAFTAAFMKRYVSVKPNGAMVVGEQLFAQPDEIAQRALERIILHMQPAPLAPRVSKRLRLLESFKKGEKKATLGGVIFTRTAAGIECAREHVGLRSFNLLAKNTDSL